MPDHDIYTVSRLNREVREWLEEGFTLLWLEGELSNLARPASGHLYFSLKDDSAQIRCAMFRQRNRLLPFRPENGQQVLIRARISLYEARGDYQLIVETMQEHGDGRLRQAFEQLKRRLASAGLFDPGHKKDIPDLPRQIGIITSPSGAAIQDILAVTRRRFPGIPLLIYPVPVQGNGAAEKIARMIEEAGLRQECDVLLLARGGGSLEDLWAFNEEVVARAIHDCPIPLVTGIGHDIDHSIADLVADLSCPTPSAAAERITPERQQWLQGLAKDRQRLQQQIDKRLQDQQERLQWLRHRLRMLHPERRLHQQMQRLDELQLRLQHALRQRHDRERQRFLGIRSRLAPDHLVRRLELARERYRQQRQALLPLPGKRLEALQKQLASDMRALDELSPLATLSRGYAVAQHADSEHLIRSIHDIQPGDRLDVRLPDGRIRCLSEEIHDE